MKISSVAVEIAPSALCASPRRKPRYIADLGGQGGAAPLAVRAARGRGWAAGRAEVCRAEVCRAEVYAGRLRDRALWRSPCGWELGPDELLAHRSVHEGRTAR